MTRCLDCGSARISDQCPSCGLTSAAAELLFRKRLIKQTTFFLAGSLLFPYLTQIYPPLDLDLMLVFFGVLFFIALGIAVVLDRRARKHQEIEILKRIYAGFIPLPWILAFAIFLNGRLDSVNRPVTSALIFPRSRKMGRMVPNAFRSTSANATMTPSAIPVISVLM